MLVRDAMTRDPVTVPLRTTITEALATLATHGISVVPVVDRSGRLRGVVSEMELIQDTVTPQPGAGRSVGPDQPRPPASVEDVCTRAAITIAPDEDIAVAVELMTASGAENLPVVARGHQLVGVVSRSDVIRALARTDVEIAADIARVLASVGRAEWSVEVEDGSVLVTGPSEVGEASLARVVAETVPGVLHVETAPG